MNLSVKKGSEAFSRLVESFKDAFLEEDYDALVENYVFPFSVLNGKQNIVIANAEAAAKSWRMLRMFYEDLGMAQIETQWVIETRLSPEFIVVDAAWRILDQAAAPICVKRTTYILSGDEQAPRIMASFLHKDTLPTFANA